MLYREAGQFKTRYAADSAIFPIRQDRIGIAIILFTAFVVAPLTLSDFWLGAVLIPMLVFALAALGLNLLTGSAGQVSLGHPFFIAAGAYAAAFIGVDLHLPMLIWLPAAALVGGAIGAVIGPFALRLRQVAVNHRGLRHRALQVAIKVVRPALPLDEDEALARFLALDDALE